MTNSFKGFTLTVLGSEVQQKMFSCVKDF